MGKNKEINKPNLILCEGEDATLFMIYYLTALIKNGEEEFNNFQAMNFGGNEELTNYLHLLPNLPNYNSVKSITIIRDAEKDYVAAIQSIRAVLKNQGFPEPFRPNEIARDDNIKVAFSLFPTLSENAKDGTLEELYINNLAESPAPDKVIKNIDIFIDDLKYNGRDFPRIHKSRLYTYFSVTDKFTSLKLAEAAKAGAFQFDCGEMNCLKKLLKARPLHKLATNYEQS